MVGNVAVIYKEAKFLCYRSRSQKNVILSSLLVARRGADDSHDPISLRCLSLLRQPLPTPDSCSLQLILSAPEYRGLAGSERPAGCQAAGTCTPGRGLSKPGSPQGSAPSRVPHRLVPGGGVGREMPGWSLEHLPRGGAGEPRLAVAPTRPLSALSSPALPSPGFLPSRSV